MELRPCSKLRTAYVLIVVISLSVTGGSVGSGGGRPKNVQVSLRSKWSGTPLLLEAGELLAKESRDLFWEFIEIWLNSDGDSDCLTARSCFKRIVEHGHSLLCEHVGSIFELSLALRSASPRLVLYRQLARDSLSSSSPAWPANPSKDVEDEGLVTKKVDDMLNGVNPRTPAGKCCWIDTGGLLLFNVSELLSWLEGLTELSGTSEQHEIFGFDHVYRGTNLTSPVVVLYGALGTDCFRDFHLHMAEAAKKGKVRYVLRPILPSGCEAATSLCGVVGTSDPLNLGGYGVELALKNMEYKAMDDNAIKKGITLEDPQTEDLSQDVRGFIFSKLLERKSELTSEIMAFRDYLLSSAISDTLEVWELNDLGHQTAQRIVHASDPLQSMQEINQNFPSIVSSISRMKLNSSIKDEIIANQRMVPSGKSLMALNGALINIDDVDLQLLLDLVHTELSLAEQFSKFKIPPVAIRRLLSAQPSSGTNSIRVDFRSTHVHYLNNLEEDAMYKRWRSNINEILMPVFPGQRRYIRKNLFTTVYVLDPATLCGSEAIDSILSMYGDSVPMRFGVILYSSKLIKHIQDNDGELPGSSVRNADSDSGEDVSLLIIRLFHYIKRTFDAQSAFQFLNNMNRLWSSSVDPTEEVPEVHHVEGALVETLQSKAKSSLQDILLKLEKDDSFKVEAEESSLFVFKRGLSKLKCCLLMNGLVAEATEDAAMNAMNEELPRIQEQVYYGHISSNTDVLEKFLSESGYRRYNTLITGEDETSQQFVSLSASSIGRNSILHDISYLHSAGTFDNLKPITHLLVVDISTKKGITLLQEGVRYLMSGSKKARVGVLFNLNDGASTHALLLAEVFRITVSCFSHKEKVLNFLDQLCSFYGSTLVLSPTFDSESLQSFNKRVYELAQTNDLPSEDYKVALSGPFLDILRSHLEKVHNFLHWQLNLEFGVNAVITNGRVILPIDGDTFLSDDLDLLESVEFEKRVKYIFDIIEEVELADVDPDDLTRDFAVTVLKKYLTVHLTVRDMPQLPLCVIPDGLLSQLELRLAWYAKGPAESFQELGGEVDLARVKKVKGLYVYGRTGVCSSYHPVDRHLFNYIQNFIPEEMNADDPQLYAERRSLERVILAGRDSILGTCVYSYHCIAEGFVFLYPDDANLGFYRCPERFTVRLDDIDVTTWQMSGPHKSVQIPDGGMLLTPSGNQYSDDVYKHHCMLEGIIGKRVLSWYDGWSVTPSHIYHRGATEWLWGILKMYRPLLNRAGIRRAVAAATFEYPSHHGLVQAFVERFDQRWNTFATGSGETTLDLWSLQRISGLPIDGQLYEELCLDDLHLYATDGAGNYRMPYCFRYLMRTWRDLARLNKVNTPNTARVSLNAWIRQYYNGPYCFHDRFSYYGDEWHQYKEVTLEPEIERYIVARGTGWNPEGLPSVTYLPTYLAYWLSTFVVPCREAGFLRAEVIYPACMLACGRRLALAPAALANIFHTLGVLTTHLFPRCRSTLLPMHYLSA